MKKDDILEEISKRETARILFLSDKKLLQEYNDWFNTNETKTDRYKMANDLYFDFMEYRSDDSEEELKEILARY